MSIAIFFEKKCVDALKENAEYLIQQLANPQDLFSIEISGAIVDTFKDMLEGDLWEMTKSLVSENADSMALGLIQAAGGGKYLDKTRQALNTVYNYASIAFLANNQFVFYLMKVVAENAIVALKAKKNITNELIYEVTRLNNALQGFKNALAPVYPDYLKRLKVALSELEQGYTRVRVTRSTLEARSRFLATTFQEAKGHMAEAHRQLRLTDTNPFDKSFWQKDGSGGELLRSPFLSGEGVLNSLGIPTTKEQTELLLAVPRITWNITRLMAEYTVQVGAVNGYISTFLGGTSLLTDALDNIVLSFAVESLWRVEQKSYNLKESMANFIEKADKDFKKAGQNPFTDDVDEEDPRNPIAVRALTPITQPAKLMTEAMKWTLTLCEIIAEMKLVPEDALAKLSRAAEDVQAYNDAVDALKELDDTGTGTSKLFAEDAKEDAFVFSQTMLTFLIQTNAALPGARVTNALQSLGRSMLSRLELANSRDDQIISIFEKWKDTELVADEFFAQAISGMRGLLAAAGLDRAADLFESGNFAEFFSLNARAATYVGYGLQGIALLKDCFETNEEKEEMTKVQRELEREQDLANLEIDFNFQLAIQANLDLCLRVEGLAGVFNLKEFLCGLADDLGADDLFNSINDLVGF